MGLGRGSEEKLLPLFETRKGKGGKIYKFFAGLVFLGICLIWVYRGSRIFSSPKERTNGGIAWVWIGMFAAELWFGFYWLLSQAFRWNPVYRSTFPGRLSHRYEKDLPRVDIFVCTADPSIEPPMMVINTVLSVMAYDYPREKLSVYLSDDGGSDITFYALLEASSFSKHWLPFCQKFHAQPTSPAAYFSSAQPTNSVEEAAHFTSLKKLYEEMKIRVEATAKLGRVSKELRSGHKGFSQWDSFSSPRDHDTILQILIDGRAPEAMDIEGCRLPTLVYLAREKRPQHPHNFKAGAMNALIRVSSKISDGPIILNVDCDMYSNNSNSVRDALCFFMDEEGGHEVAFVQFPQTFSNNNKNDIYSGSLSVMTQVDFHGLDGVGGPLYIGSGCFHRRDSLCGIKFTNERSNNWRRENYERINETTSELEERLKPLASCVFDINTQWGKEIGLKYGCPVEDVITGLFIQCQGWRSIYHNPERRGFLGIAPTTLAQTLVQHQRWSEGDLQIFLSKYNPIWYGFGKISPLLQMGYCTYCLWAPGCFATIYYSVIPSLYFLKGIPLFPEISSPWFLPFAFIILSRIISTSVEFISSGGTMLGWWNDQRIWLYKRTSSYLFACIDTALKLAGFASSAFSITAKVSDEEVSRRYEQELMDFGASSPMFTILSTIAMLNLFCLVGFAWEVAMGGVATVLSTMPLQVLLCALLVLINLPLYQGLFFREDNGRMPTSVTVKAVGLALFACASSGIY